MPIYTFRNKNSGDIVELNMSISELDEFTKTPGNEHLEQIITSGTKIVHERGTNLRVPDSFREALSKVKETYTVNNIKDY